MPLYEYFCDGCRESFEALVRFSASQQNAELCPACGAPSRRILSAVNFGVDRAISILPQGRGHDGKPDVTSLRLPPAARLCWMDDQSAARLAAYKAGRGAEHDDTVAIRQELASRRENESIQPRPPAHSHPPLSNPVVLENRRKAAQKEKVAESTAIMQHDAGKKV
jgi:putative FmdB family regulatory protein